MEALRGAFGRVRQHGELIAVEILWKWAWAATILAVAMGSAALFLDSVSPTEAEWRGLRSRMPWLVALTLRRLWQRHVGALAETTLIVVAAAALLWWLAASVFRSGIAGALLAEGGEEQAPLARFGPSVRESLEAYLGSHLWALGVTAATLWLAGQLLLATTAAAAEMEGNRTSTYVGAVISVAALLFFWQMVVWVLSLGRAAASRHGWGFLTSLGFALRLLGDRTVDVLFVASSLFLFRAMAFVAAGSAGLALLYGAVVVQPRLAPAALLLAMILISVPARWLFLVQQAAFLELARE